MPRQGEGHVAHNSTEEIGGPIQHDAPQAQHNQNKNQDSAAAPSAIDRSAKAAPAPEHEKGAGLDDMSASAGHSQGLTQGGQGGRQS
jgi:hypothetical protein